MTTQATTVRQGKSGVRALIGAALWQVRPLGHGATPVRSAAIGTVSEGAPALGGLAERYRDQARAAAAEREARVTTMGGMAELYAARQAEAAAIAEVERRMGGMAELYRAQELAQRTLAP